jgi:hypothetical protein
MPNMKPFSLRVLVVHYVVPLDELLARKTDKLAKIVPVSQTSQRPVTLLGLNQLVTRLPRRCAYGREKRSAFWWTGVKQWGAFMSGALISFSVPSGLAAITENVPAIFVGNELG